MSTTEAAVKRSQPVGGYTPTLLEAALVLAGDGIPVFPCSRTKTPIVANGFLDATTDPSIVQKLFAAPGAQLIGVPTGPASGLDCLDLDYRHGATAFETANRSRLPETHAHETMSGGRHLLFKCDPRVRNSASRIAPGVDVRGTGGYIIVPPSPGYTVISDAPVAPWPDWLLQPGLLLPHPPPQRPISSGEPYVPVAGSRLEGFRSKVLGNVRSAGDGQKHTQLRNAGLALGGIAAEAGFSDEEAIQTLMDALPAGVRNWTSARNTAAWAVAAGREKPIELQDRLKDKTNGASAGPRPDDAKPELDAEPKPKPKPDHPDMLDNPDMSVLRLHRRPPPALPIEVFGPSWATWIAITAKAAACPSDYVAAPLLSIASVVIGNARWAEAWPGWTEPPHLWTCSVGDSGSSKSPGADVLLRDVLPTLEQRMSVNHPEAMRAWMAAAEVDKAAREIWEDAVRKAQKSGLAVSLPPTTTAPQKPETPRLRQNDVTIEKVAVLLASAAPKGLLVHRDELLGWVAGMRTYNDAGRAFWIEAFGGRPYRVERQKHPEPIDVPRLAVAVFGGTQPAKVAGLLTDADDGLLGRILWFWPDSVPFAMGAAAPGIPWAIDALDHLRRLELLPGDGPDVASRPVLVTLNKAARPDMVTFGVEMQTRQEGSAGLMQSAYGKARGLSLRLSLVLTYLRWVGDGAKGSPPTVIEPEGFAAAAYLVADYLIPMAERVYGDAATRQEDRDAATLARWIIKTRPAEVHVRTLQRSVRLPGLNMADAIHAAAAVLVEAGWLVPPRPGSFQQRARAAYQINQRVYEVAT